MIQMKIVLTDAQTVVDEAVTADILKQFGEVEAHGLLRYEEVADKVTDADLIVCNKTLLNEYTLRKADRLRYIGLFATGYNNIDIEYCRKKGIVQKLYACRNPHFNYIYRNFLFKMEINEIRL